MKEMVIYDPAMCCSTGICGPSVDKNLLRVATTVNSLNKKGIKVERHNLSDNPQAYIDNKEVNRLLNEQGVDVLPITFMGGKVVKTSDYLTDEEFISLLEIPQEYIKSEKPKKVEIVGVANNDSSNCCGGTGCC